MDQMLQMQNLHLSIYFPLQNPEAFKLESDIKSELIADILSDYIRGQIGLGEDHSKPNVQDVYHINISVDLSTDTFKCHSDTGNSGLTLGILMHIVKMLNESCAPSSIGEEQQPEAK